MVQGMTAQRPRAAEAPGEAEARWPTPHELRAFVRLAETLHFGRTARMLGLAQSSLSEAIRRLEAKLGVVLLERTSRRVSLTEAGARLLPVARTILNGLAAARTAVVDPPAGATDTLRIGIEGSGLVELNRPVLAAIGDRHPHARLVVRESLGPARAFAEQRLDIALVRSPGDESLVVHPVAKEERGLLVPPGHHLARRGQGSLRDVLDEPFVAVAPRAARTRDYWLAVEHRGGRAPVLGGAAHSMQEVAHAVGHLGLITTGCRSQTRSHPFPDVAFVPADDLPPNIVGVATRRGESRPAVLALVDLITEVVTELSGSAPGLSPVR